MSWDKYRKSRLLRIGLDGINLDGFWIDVRKIKSFTGAEADEIDKARQQAEDDTKANKEEADKSLAQFLGMLIINWNVTDPDNESIVLPLPKTDPSVVKKLPLEIFSYLNERINEEEGKPAVPPT